MSRLALFPRTTRVVPVNGRPQLTVDGHPLAALAARYGTPLYLYDQATLDAAADEYLDALKRHYPAPAGLTYAGKAFLAPRMARWAAERGLWVDCTGAGEIALAAAGGVPPAGLLVHGVNKTPADMQAAQQRAATVVVDHPDELRAWLDLRRRGAPLPQLWLRLRPGVDVETHAHIQTGQAVSKFGFGLEEAADAVRLCCEHNLPLTGLHFHLGSNFRDPAPLRAAVHSAADFAARMRARHAWQARHFSPGGGWGVAYHEDDLPHPPVAGYVRAVAAWVQAAFRRRGLPPPILHLEPGRSLAARAGVALYRVGAVKTAGGRRWLLVDGGLADNPRPALYGARYTALPVHWPQRPPVEPPAWVGGPFCESGDVLLRGLPLPDVRPGDLLAVPMSGAYHLSMGSNYNGARRPAVLWLRRGRVRLIRRRQSPADLAREWENAS